MIIRTLENILNKISENMSDGMPDMLDKILENMSNGMPDKYAKQIVRWNKLDVMMGITGNKIIFLYLIFF